MSAYYDITIFNCFNAWKNTIESLCFQHLQERTVVLDMLNKNTNKKINSQNYRGIKYRINVMQSHLT